MDRHKKEEIMSKKLKVDVIPTYRVALDCDNGRLITTQYFDDYRDMAEWMGTVPLSPGVVYTIRVEKMEWVPTTTS